MISQHRALHDTEAAAGSCQVLTHSTTPSVRSLPKHDRWGPRLLSQPTLSDTGLTG